MAFRHLLGFLPLSVIGALLPEAIVKRLSAPIRTYPLDYTTMPRGSESVAVRWDLPEGRGFTVVLPVGLRALLDGVPARLVPPVVVATADHDVPLVPDNE